MWNETSKTIAARLRERREALGYSYQQLADLTGMSKSTLQRYETGAIKNIPLARLETLTTALKTTPEKLLGLQLVQNLGNPSTEGELPDDYAAINTLLNPLGYRITERMDGYYFDGMRQWGLLSEEEMADLRDKMEEYLDLLMMKIERDIFLKQREE